MMNNGLTISDIHKIRTDNYNQTKELSNDELLEKTKKVLSYIFCLWFLLRNNNKILLQ
jgi:hypothetical protein